MKLVCDCGNECYFSEYDKKGVKLHYTEDEGQYVIAESNGNGFRFWQMHDVVGIVCEKCNKDLWLFT